MLLALRSLYEPSVVVPPVTPPSTGAVGGGRWMFPKTSIPAEVTLRPARAKFRTGKLTVTAGANITLLPVVGSFSLGKLEVSAAANVQTESARATFQPRKITATGVDNDPLIAMAILDL